MFILSGNLGAHFFVRPPQYRCSRDWRKSGCKKHIRELKISGSIGGDGVNEGAVWGGVIIQKLGGHNLIRFGIRPSLEIRSQVDPIRCVKINSVK